VLAGVARHRVRVPESDVEIALLDWGGEGPLAFLHHANGFCAGVWAPVAEQLRGHFRVIAMDARGHGGSSAPLDEAAYAWDRLALDVAAAAEWARGHAGRSGVAIAIGHSFGGTLTLGAAALRPRLFERALLVDPVILPPDQIEAAKRGARTSEIAERARKRRTHWASREEARAFFAERELFDGWDARALAAYVAEGLRDAPGGGVELCCRREVEAAIFGGAHTIDAIGLAPRVRSPVRLLRASRGSFPREAYAALAARLPRAELRDVDAGHLVPMERPDAVVDEALVFARERS
jgi:pimeloyl-ACP methyl ester carboxylesterase